MNAPALAAVVHGSPVAESLRDANLTPEQFDEVLMVGGASRMPNFVDTVARLFDRLPNRQLPPDEAGAIGAAVQAALRADDVAVEDLVVTDVAPFSLGIAVAQPYGSGTSGRVARRTRWRHTRATRSRDRAAARSARWPATQAYRTGA